MGDDIWSRWRLKRRFGGDPQRMQTMQDRLDPVRDRVFRWWRANKASSGRRWRTFALSKVEQCHFRELCTP
jgi:hypothetical protein